MDSTSEDIERKINLQDDILELISIINENINVIQIGNQPLIFWLILKDKLGLIKKLHSGFYGNERLDLNMKCISRGITPLQYACELNNFDIVKFLLDEGVDPNIKDQWDSTPLHRCDRKKSIEIVSLLLDRGADINAQDNKGWTLLHYCDNIKCKKLASFLLDRGADLEVKDKRGLTVLYLMCVDGNPEMVKFYLENGSKIEYENRSLDILMRKYRLFKTREEGYEEISNIFLEFRMKGIKGIPREG